MSWLGSRSAPAAVTWFGHATVLLELGHTRLLTDPALCNRIGPLVRIAPAVPMGAIGRVDCVLLSHLHADHADLRTLRKLARSTPVLAPYPAARWLGRHGVRDVHELRAGENFALGGSSVTATPARHDRRRRPLGPGADPIGYVVRGSRTVYFAGDTDLFTQMAELGGDIDLALLPVSGWGPTLPPGHLDPQRAARAAALINPKVAIPIHWGTFALGRPARRPADHGRPAREFAALADRYAPSVRVLVLAPGERAEL